MRNIIVSVCLYFVASSAFATPIEWDINFTLSDGATGSGSFYYDQDSNSYTGISITTTAGEAPFNGETFEYLMPSNQSSAAALFLVSDLPGDLTGVPGMYFILNGSLIDPSGTYQIIEGFESFCADFYCNDNASELREIYSGTVTASAVPVPAAVWLFGSALAGLGWVRRKQSAWRSLTKVQ